MGSAEPHRRKKGQESAFVMSVDVCGPFVKGTNLGVSKRRKVKYALIATIPVPQWPTPGETEALPKDPKEDPEAGSKDVPKGGDDVPPAAEPPAELVPVEKEPEDLLLDPEPKDLIPEAEAKRRNQAWEDYVKNEVQEISKEIPVINVTLMEPIASRHQDELTKALSKLHARARSLGIPVYRLHSDRERSMTTKGIAKWCESRQIYQTFNAGDEPEANGRVEGEVHQFKRRLRLLLRDAGVDHAYWPCAARHGAEERLRSQLRKLGAKCKEMPPFAVLAQVKAKRWHRLKEGALSSPYKTLRIMGPSPAMTNGWVALDEAANLVQHARSVFVPDPLSDIARLELEAVDDPKHPPRRRLYGKQPRDGPGEVSKVPIPPSKVDHEMEALLELQPEADRELEDLLDLQPAVDYEAESDGYSPSVLDDSDVVPPAMAGDGPAEGGPALLSKVRAGGESLPSGTQFIGWGEIQKAEIQEYVQELRFQHLNFRRLLQEQVNSVADTEEEGTVQGYVIGHVADQVECLERDLGYYSAIEEEVERSQALDAAESTKEFRMAAMSMAEQAEHPKDDQVPKDGGKPPTVLQTYTVPLAAVKQNLDDWIGPIKAEYDQLVSESRAVKPVTLQELERMPGYQNMELAPSKLVTTVKAPHGKHKARIVICGNLVTSAQGDKPKEQVDRSELYAGGADATAIRCMVRKTAMTDGWDMGVLDIKGAFLLAPRRREQDCLMMTVPPRVLVQAKICSADERWLIQKAMYGLETSPADWSVFRDQRVRKFTWNLGGRTYFMRQTTELNVWAIVSTSGSVGSNQDEKVEGFCTFYVDDVLVCGPTEVIKTCLDRVNQEWTCSPAEYLSEKGSLRFCGMEFKKHPKGGIHLAQEAYTRELLERYPNLKECSVPLARAEDCEEEPDAAAVKQAQTLVGELLWVSTKTRPDIAFAVSWMGSRATKNPKRVCQMGMQTLGYLKGTVGHGLWYGPLREADRGPNGNLAFCRDATTLEVHSDASFGPGGERSHQGLLAVWAGGLIQWESKRQSFATLSSSEAEVASYVDAMSLGDSVAVLVDLFEEGRLTDQGTRVLYGDSQSGIQVILNPNGPWRSRHLRLRSRALHEAVQQEVWKVKHMAGVELAADFLTKPITVGTTWSRFRTFAGLCDLNEPEDVETLKKIGICREWALKGLTVAVELEKWKPESETQHQIRRLGLVAVGQAICHVVQKWKSHLCCLKRKERPPRENEPGLGKPPTEKGWLRENKPSPNHQMKKLRENEPSTKTLNPQSSFGDDFGKSCFGNCVEDSTYASSGGRSVQVDESFVTAAWFNDHCPTGCPQVKALRAEAMASSAAAAAGGAGDGGRDGDDPPRWQKEAMENDYETGEKRKRRRKKKRKSRRAETSPAPTVEYHEEEFPIAGQADLLAKEDMMRLVKLRKK